MPSIPSTSSSGPFSLLLKLHPTPTKLSESRTILQHIQSRFGAVNAFVESRHSNRSHNYIFTILGSKADYENALASSPIVINAEIPTLNDSIQEKNKPPPPASLLRRANSGSTEVKQFHCEILPSNYNHDEAIRFNPFSGPYRVDQTTLSYQTIRTAGAPDRASADFQQKRAPFFNKKSFLDRVQLSKHGLMGAWKQAGQEMDVQPGLEPTDGDPRNAHVNESHTLGSTVRQTNRSKSGTVKVATGYLPNGSFSTRSNPKPTSSTTQAAQTTSKPNPTDSGAEVSSIDMLNLAEADSTFSYFQSTSSEQDLESFDDWSIYSNDHDSAAQPSNDRKVLEQEHDRGDSNGTKG